MLDWERWTLMHSSVAAVVLAFFSLLVVLAVLAFALGLVVT